jgi:hypothetical protein
MRTPTRDAPQVDVAIVCANVETLDGLQAYLCGAGVRAKSFRKIDDCVGSAPESVLAFIVFPDDYPWESVLAALATLSEKRPHVLPVLVTSQPARFEGLVDREHVVLVPRPAWGWTIAEAIRSHVRSDLDEAR